MMFARACIEERRLERMVCLEQRVHMDDQCHPSVCQYRLPVLLQTMVRVMAIRLWLSGNLHIADMVDTSNTLRHLKAGTCRDGGQCLRGFRI